MSSTANIIRAAKIDPRLLWQMSAEDFNEWRRVHDYPRIISFFKRNLPEFQSWMHDQLVTDGILIKHSPATFLKEKPIYLYTVFENDTEEREVLSPFKYGKEDHFFQRNVVKQQRVIIPYPTWYRRRIKKRPPAIYVNQRSGRSHLISSELELLDVGNCHISGLLLGNRKLDFVNISDLQITNCFNNSSLELSFSSAFNLTLKGDLPFVDAYQTRFSEWINGRSNNLKLLNGAFQRWNLIDCDIDVFADNAVLQLWNVTGEYFDATINSTDIRDCTFKSSPIQFPIQLGRARVFHANIKRLYSQLGKKKEASQHYYWERTYERKSFLHIRANHQHVLLGRRSKIGKVLVRLNFLLKYVKSAFLNILWGYGERPARVFAISVATIFVFAVCYCYLPNASKETYHHFGNALYSSIVTFTTGDINQKDEVIRLLAGLEALLGLSFWGILIAGFTNNAKDY